jgi:hypothetical protein
MTHTVPAFPLDTTLEEQKAGFRRTVLSLGNFVGAFPGEDVEVVARRLSESDVLIKMQTIRKGKSVINYRHLRFGYPSLSEQIRICWRDIRFGFGRAWFKGYWPWKVDWQHIPNGLYYSPADDCSRTLSWPDIVGIAFHEAAA